MHRPAGSSWTASLLLRFRCWTVAPIVSRRVLAVLPDGHVLRTVDGASREPRQRRAVTSEQRRDDDDAPLDEMMYIHCSAPGEALTKTGGHDLTSSAAYRRSASVPRRRRR